MNRPRARLGTYALWQARDYFTSPAIWTVIVSFVLGMFPLIMATKMSGRQGMRPEMASQMLTQAFGTFVGILATLGSLLTIARLVSKDRSPGLSRFLFAKPVGVRQYYAQAWIVRTLAFLAIAAAMTFSANQFVTPGPWLEGVGAVAVAWTLIGGVGLLLSVVTAQDAGALVVVYLVPDMLDGFSKFAPDWNWILKPLLTILPPMHRLDEIRNALINHTPMPQADLWHALGYGLGCAALAIYLVRRMPLVR